MAGNIINTTYPDILRKAGVHQTTASLPWLGPKLVHRITTATGATSTYVQRHGAKLKSFEIHNRAGSTINVGIGFRYANHIWKVGRYDGTTYTDITTNAQGRTAVAIQVTGADQTGMVILSQEKFDWVSADITTAETNAGGATTVDHVLRYSDPGGDSWITLAAASTYVDGWSTTDAVWGTGAKNFVWAAPSDWEKNVSNTGLPDGYYALHFQSAQREASDVAAVITGIEIGSMYAIDSLPDNSVWSEGNANYSSPYGDALVAFFGTAAAGNRVIAEVESA